MFRTPLVVEENVIIKPSKTIRKMCGPIKLVRKIIGSIALCIKKIYLYCTYEEVIDLEQSMNIYRKAIVVENNKVKWIDIPIHDSIEITARHSVNSIAVDTAKEWEMEHNNRTYNEI